MNRRESLMALAGSAVSGLGAASASGCAAAQRLDSRMVIDDGVTDITPVYVMTYTDGQATAFVRADYYSFDAKKQFQLRTDGSIKVNGVALERDSKELVSYIGNIPVTESFTFEFTRQAGRVIKHSFALPQLEIVALPRDFSRLVPVLVAVKSGPAPVGVMEDKYNMTVFGRFGESRLSGQLTGVSELTFESTQYSASPPGRYRADIYRQQRTALKDISDNKTGWAVASHGHNFAHAFVDRPAGRTCPGSGSAKCGK